METAPPEARLASAYSNIMRILSGEQGLAPEIMLGVLEESRKNRLPSSGPASLPSVLEDFYTLLLQTRQIVSSGPVPFHIALGAPQDGALESMGRTLKTLSESRAQFANFASLGGGKEFYMRARLATNLMREFLNEADFAHGIPVSGINLVERCLAGCPFCSIDAKAKGPQMEFGLLESMARNPRISFPDGIIHLVNGEPLIYSEGGKNLGDAIKTLAEGTNAKINLTTAGLIPVNRKQGLEAFATLSTLGRETLSRLEVNVSFTLLNLRSMDEKTYIAAIDETFSKLRNLNVPLVGAIVITDSANEDRTMGAFRQFGRKYEPQVSARYVEPEVGRAKLQNYAVPESAQGTKACTYLEEGKARLSIGAGGRVSIGCQKPGANSDTLGNININSVQELKEAHDRFISGHKARMAKLGGAHPCEAHRTQGADFSRMRA